MNFRKVCFFPHHRFASLLIDGHGTARWSLRHGVSGVATDPGILGILGAMGGPHLCEFESLKSCALDVVEMDGRIYVQGLAGSWNIA